MKHLRQRGDTIIEVLLAMSVIGLILGSAFGIANRSVGIGQNAQERIEALKLAEAQLEYLRGYVTEDVDWDAGNLCFDSSGNPAADEASCSFGPEEGNGGRYKIRVLPADNDTYTAVASWDTVSGNPASLSLFYRLPQPVPFAFTPPPPPPTPPTDTDGDGVPDSSDACPEQPAATPNGCPPLPPVVVAWQADGASYAACVATEPLINDGADGCFKLGNSMYSRRNVRAAYNITSNLKPGPATLEIGYRQYAGAGTSVPSGYPHYQIKVILTGSTVVIPNIFLPTAATGVARVHTQTINISSNQPAQFSLEWLNNSGNDPDLQIDSIKITQEQTP